MFNIKFKKSKEIAEPDLEDTTYSEAIETIYSINDKLIIIWKGVDIILSFKYDLSDIWNDIIKSISNIENDFVESLTFEFPSQTFFGSLSIVKKNEYLLINAKWDRVNGGEEKLEKLKAVGLDMKIKKEYFLNEWIGLVNEVECDIKKSGYQGLTI